MTLKRVSQASAEMGALSTWILRCSAADSAALISGILSPVSKTRSNVKVAALAIGTPPTASESLAMPAVKPKVSAGTTIGLVGGRRNADRADSGHHNGRVDRLLHPVQVHIHLQRILRARTCHDRVQRVHVEL